MEKGLTTRWAKPATDYNIRKLVYRGTSTGSSFLTPLFRAARGSQCGLGLLSQTTESTYIVLALLFCFLGFFPPFSFAWGCNAVARWISYFLSRDDFLWWKVLVFLF